MNLNGRMKPLPLGGRLSMPWFPVPSVMDEAGSRAWLLDRREAETSSPSAYIKCTLRN